MYKKSVSLLTIDTTLPASGPLRFRKNLLPSYNNDSKWSDQNFRQKNYAKEAQFDLDRKAAKISTLSSNKLDK